MNHEVHDMTVFEAMDAVMRMHGNGSPFVIHINHTHMSSHFVEGPYMDH